MNCEAFEKGRKTRREVLGSPYDDGSIKYSDDFNMPMHELVTECCCKGADHTAILKFFQDNK